MSSLQFVELQQLEEKMENAIQVFSWTTFLGQLAMSYSLKYLWNTINILQFAVFMSQWQLSLPNNGGSFLRLLKSLALMEFIPTERIIDFFSSTLGCDIEPNCADCIEDSEASSRQLEEQSDPSNFENDSSSSAMQNLGSNNLVRNLGIMLVIALAIVILLIVIRLMKCTKHRYQKVHTLYRKVNEKVFYNLFIRYIL